jgi:hypothetical protein
LRSIDEKHALRKRAIILLLIFLSIILTTVALHFFKHAGEPKYNGKALTTWLDIAARADTRESTQSAAEAVRHMGTNALPFLLTMVRAKESALTTKAARLWLSLFRDTPWDSADDRQKMAEVAFGMLERKDVQPAIPPLTKMLNDPDPRIRRSAFACLYMATNSNPDFYK